MSSIKSQVAVATNIPTLSSSQSQKDYSTEETLGRQNSFGNNRRGNMKGKHLTRSHAMRESTSPPRTPTPRAEHGQVSPNGQTPQTNYHHQHHQQQQVEAASPDCAGHNSQSNSIVNNSNTSNNNNNNNNNGHHHNNNKLQAQSMTTTRGNSPIMEAPAVIVTSQHSQQQQQQQQQPNVAALCNEAEFPKLTPPKSTKAAGGGTAVGGGQQQRNNNNGPNEGSHKMDYSNNGSNNNNNGNKKICADGGRATASSIGGIGPHDTHKTANSGAAKLHHQSSATNALHQALNNELTNSPRGGQHGGGAGANAATGNGSNTAASNYSNSGMNYQLNTSGGGGSSSGGDHYGDKENRYSHPRNDSQNSNFNDDDGGPHQQSHHHQQAHYDRSGGPGGNKKHRTNSNSKSSKPRLKNVSSSSGSIEGGGIVGSSNSNNSSGFISRENSNEQFTDHGGTDLLSFFKETLNKNMKDRHILLKIEKELIEFVQDKSRNELRFPSASSYNRMLIHRTAAFFGLDHNVDTETQQCVIVATTKSTRIPEIRFKSLVRDHRDDSRKSILKRDTHSFDEARQSSYLCPDRGNMLDRKTKSFEEREEDYERARSRIFNRSQMEAGGVGGDCGDENYMNISWEQQSNRARPNNKMLKMQNSTESREVRAGGAVPKSHTYGGYGGGVPNSGGGSSMLRGDSVGSGKNSGSRSYIKQDSTSSTSAPWRVSPSSNGYKVPTQSMYSIDPLATSSPSAGIGIGAGGGVGYGSDEQTPEHHASMMIEFCSQSNPSPAQLSGGPTPAMLLTLPSLAPAASSSSTASSSSAVSPSSSSAALPDAQPAPCGLVWAVTDILNVPKGSVLINPQTLQPILNQDGTVYHFDPSNLPPNQVMPSGSSYHPHPSSSPNAPNTIYGSQPQLGVRKPPAVLSPQPVIETPTPTPSATETMSESATQTVNLDSDFGGEASPNSDNGSSDIPLTATGSDECDNTNMSGLTVNTTTATISPKGYDRNEMQKFKNQATSPNIPIDSDKEPTLAKRENSASSESSTTRDQPSRNQSTPQLSSGGVQPQHQQQPHHRDTPHSARSTPFGGSNSEHNNPKRASEEPKATTWAYPQSYQAPDGSTVFHTASTPNGTPFCATTYQQGPDGSVYAIPQSMVYAAYPQPVEGDVQSYFMPIFDPSQQRADPTASLIQAGAQATAVYPTAGGTATMVPVATTAAYPTAQFATANGTPIYPGQVIYSSDQFGPSNAAVAAANSVAAAAAAAAANNAQLQQIPMATYPIGYPYPYNGYWGQAMTYYVPQQALTNAVAGPLLQAPAAQVHHQAPPPAGAASGMPGQHHHVAGGVNLANGIITTAAAAPPPVTSAGPASNSTVAALSSGGGAGIIGHAGGGAGGTPVAGTFQAHTGATYFGTGRIKRPPPAHHFSAPQNGAQLMAAIPGNGATTTTYQLGHAVPTLTLATPANGVGGGGGNDLSTSGTTGGTPSTTMYALPQHALFPANMIPYAAAAAAAASGGVPGGAGPATHIAPGAALAAPPPATGNANGANAPQSNPVIASFYAHHPQIHPSHAAAAAAAAAMHGGGSAAIPIVDPRTMSIVQVSTANGESIIHGMAGAVSTTQSAPSTPQSMPPSQGPSRNQPGAMMLPPQQQAQPASVSACSTPHAVQQQQQQSNPVITSFYHPQIHAHSAAAAAAMHAAGSAAIPIVNPRTMSIVQVSAANGEMVSSTSQSAPSTPHSVPAQIPVRNPPLFSTPPIMTTTGGNGSYSTSSTPHFYNPNEQQQGAIYLPGAPPFGSHDKRGGNGTGKKPPVYPNGNMNRQSTGGGATLPNNNNNNSGGVNSPYGGPGKTPLLSNNNNGGDARHSPHNNNNNVSGYQPGNNVGGQRSHAACKRGTDNNNKPQQTPLLSGPPPSYLTGGGGPPTSTSANYHPPHHAAGGGLDVAGKSAVRLNAAAASFRQKPDFRRSVSQRNSPGTNTSSSNEASNNTSPNSITAASQAPPPPTTTMTPIAMNCYAPMPTAQFVSANGVMGGGGVVGGHGGNEHATLATQAVAAAPPSLYIAARGAHIPPQMQHGGAIAAAGSTAAAMAAGSQQAAATAAILGNAAAAMGTYNPAAASGVYFKYGQTYFAHPSVAMPNSRRSPSTDMRPPMAQMAGMYPTVNMMIPAPPRHMPGRHPNPNYKGTRPR